MKQTNVILFALFFLLSLGQLWAQKALPFKAKTEFKLDTLRYLEYNFDKRSTYYKGKTAGELLKDLEYPVIYAEGIYKFMLDNSTEPPKLGGLTLGIRQVGKESNELKDYYIVISFENPPLLDDYLAIHDRQNSALTSQLYDFIKDLKISNVFSNENILKDPELKKARKQAHISSLEKMLEDAKQSGAAEEDLKPAKKIIERLKKD